MSILKAYEVHTLERSKWRIEAIFDEKGIAIDHAKSLIGGPVVSARVVEETLDTETDQCVSKVVYRDSTAPLRQIPSSAPAPAPTTAAGGKTPSAVTWKGTTRPTQLDPFKRLALYVAGIGGSCVGLVFGLAYLLGVHH